MSTDGHAPKAPKAIVEQLDADAALASPREEEPSEAPHASESTQAAEPARGFHGATIGFFERLGRVVWAYADAHPHATLYGIIGFALAVLILAIGLWDTIVIAVFVLVGTVIGQMVDGDNAAVNFMRRLFDGRK